ncbi:hypothetical protein E8E11_003384 [Didymella keratinophila]|nr:hypothetical protein E8E11_003384 [Didymella keratinophila]
MDTFWATGQFCVEYNAGAVRMRGPNYGTYTTWDKNAAHCGDVAGFPRGRLTLEAQALLMRFLRKTVELLLGGKHDAGTSASQNALDTFTTAALKFEKESTVFSSSARLPFAAPPQFDIDALVKLANRAFGALEAFLAAKIEIISKQVNATIAQRPGFRNMYTHDSIKRDERGAYYGGFYIKKIVAPSGETYETNRAAVSKYTTYDCRLRRRDKAWLKQFDVLHKSMQKYWKASSNSHRNTYKKMDLSEADTTFAMEALCSCEHPEYIARLSAKRAQVLADLDRSVSASCEDTFLPLPTTLETIDTTPKPSTRVKVKTRGKAPIDQGTDANPSPRAPQATTL